jgi:hypothetical protein
MKFVHATLFVGILGSLFGGVALAGDAHVRQTLSHRVEVLLWSLPG